VPPGLTLQWVESQDEPVDLPPVRNFGRVLLESVVPAAVTGQSCLEMGPSGILYRLQIRSDELVDRPGVQAAPCPERRNDSFAPALLTLQERHSIRKEIFMNWDRIKGNWREYKGKAQAAVGQAHRRRPRRNS
jgi:hypothetical protein